MNAWIVSKEWSLIGYALKKEPHLFGRALKKRLKDQGSESQDFQDLLRAMEEQELLVRQCKRQDAKRIQSAFQEHSNAEIQEKWEQEETRGEWES